MVIGAPKGGTTWLHANLRQHYDIFTGVKKELNFFNHNYSKGIAWYRRQFAGYSGQKAIGDFSPGYLWANDAPTLVHRHYPDIKLILSLRNPVDRTISAFYHNIRARRVSPNSRILDLNKDHPTFTIGFYDIHLERWFEVFPSEQFLILFYEENIIKNKDQTLRKVFQFIGVDESFEPLKLEEKHNARSSHLSMRVNYYSPLLAKILDRVLPSNLMNPSSWTIPVSDEELEQLKCIFVKHNERLSALLKRKLPW
jgi:hypothetical protein